MAFNINTMRELLELTSNKNFDIDEAKRIIQGGAQVEAGGPPPPPPGGAKFPPAPPPPPPPGRGRVNLPRTVAPEVEGINLVLKIAANLRSSNHDKKQTLSLIKDVVSDVSEYNANILLKNESDENKKEFYAMLWLIISHVIRNQTDASVMVEMVNKIKSKNNFEDIKNIANHYLTSEQLKNKDFIKKEIEQINALKDEFLNLAIPLEISARDRIKAENIIKKRDNIEKHIRESKKQIEQYNKLLASAREKSPSQSGKEAQINHFHVVSGIIKGEGLKFSDSEIQRLAFPKPEQKVSDIIDGMIAEKNVRMLGSKRANVITLINDANFLEKKRLDETVKNKENEEKSELRDNLFLLDKAYTAMKNHRLDATVKNIIEYDELMSEGKINFDYEELKQLVQEFFDNKNNIEILNKINELIKNKEIHKLDSQKLGDLIQGLTNPINKYDLSIPELVVQASIKRLIGLDNDGKFIGTTPRAVNSIRYMSQVCQYLERSHDLHTLYSNAFKVTGMTGPGIAAGKLFLDTFNSNKNKEIKNVSKNKANKKNKPYLTGLIVQLRNENYYVISDEYEAQLKSINESGSKPIEFVFDKENGKKAKIVTQKQMSGVMSRLESATVPRYVPYLGLLTNNQEKRLANFFMAGERQNWAASKNDWKDAYTDLMQNTEITMGDVLQVAFGYHYRSGKPSAEEIDALEREGYYLKSTHMRDDFFKENVTLKKDGDIRREEPVKEITGLINVESRDMGVALAEEMGGFINDSRTENQEMINQKSQAASELMSNLLELVGGNEENNIFMGFHQKFKRLFKQVENIRVPLDILSDLLQSNPDPENAQQFAKTYSEAVLVNVSNEKIFSEIDAVIKELDNKINQLIQDKKQEESQGQEEAIKAAKLAEIIKDIEKDYPGADPGLVRTLAEARYQLEVVGADVKQLGGAETGVDQTSREEMERLKKQVSELTAKIRELTAQIKEDSGYQRAELEAGERDRALWMAQNQLAQQEAIQRAQAEALARREAEQNALMEELRQKQAELNARQNEPQQPPQAAQQRPLTLVEFFKNSGFNVRETLEYARNALQLDSVNARELKGSLGRIANRGAMNAQVQQAVNDYNSNKGDNYRDAGVRRNRP